MEEKVYPGEIDLDVIPLPKGSLVSHIVEDIDGESYQVSTRTENLSLNEIMEIVDTLVTMVSIHLETDRIALVTKMFIRESEKLLLHTDSIEKTEGNIQLIETHLNEIEEELVDGAKSAMDIVNGVRRIMENSND